VKECWVGRALGMRKMDIRARGKFGMIHLPKCSIRIVLEEKPLKDFYKMLMKGEAPPSVGAIFRKMLYQNEANFEQVKKVSYLTTSWGRYYRKTQFRRLVKLV
jgi:hypothetical protein